MGSFASHCKMDRVASHCKMGSFASCCEMGSFASHCKMGSFASHCKMGSFASHTGYPETTIATENNHRGLNQHVTIGASFSKLTSLVNVSNMTITNTLLFFVDKIFFVDNAKDSQLQRILTYLTKNNSVFAYYIIYVVSINLTSCGLNDDVSLLS